MGNIFINYRRSDTSDAAGRLHYPLEKHFGKDHIFMDVDQIAGGVDFVDELQAQLNRTNVLLAIIGPNWLTLTDEITGKARISNPKDYVRIEIENALADEIEIIPVLVNEAVMPRSEDLPDSLKRFARLNAMRLTHEQYGGDTQNLIKNIEIAFKRSSERKKTKQLKEKEELERFKSNHIEAAEAIANWEFIKESKNPEDFRNHISRYGTHEASLEWAKKRLEDLTWQEDQPSISAEDALEYPKKEEEIEFLSKVATRDTKKSFFVGFSIIFFLFCTVIIFINNYMNGLNKKRKYDINENYISIKPLKKGAKKTLSKLNEDSETSKTYTIKVLDDSNLFSQKPYAAQIIPLDISLSIFDYVTVIGTTRNAKVKFRPGIGGVQLAYLRWANQFVGNALPKNIKYTVIKRKK